MRSFWEPIFISREQVINNGKINYCIQFDEFVDFLRTRIRIKEYDTEYAPWIYSIPYKWTPDILKYVKINGTDDMYMYAFKWGASCGDINVLNWLEINTLIPLKFCLLDAEQATSGAWDSFEVLDWLYDRKLFALNNFPCISYQLGESLKRNVIDLPSFFTQKKPC